jgi:hypothetical protein
MTRSRAARKDSRRFPLRCNKQALRAVRLFKKQGQMLAPSRNPSEELLNVPLQSFILNAFGKALRSEQTLLL